MNSSSGSESKYYREYNNVMYYKWKKSTKVRLIIDNIQELFCACHWSCPSSAGFDRSTMEKVTFGGRWIQNGKISQQFLGCAPLITTAWLFDYCMTLPLGQCLKDLMPKSQKTWDWISHWQFINQGRIWWMKQVSTQQK